MPAATSTFRADAVDGGLDHVSLAPLSLAGVVAGRSLASGPVSGTVYVHARGAAARFALRARAVLPFGSAVDAREGIVKLTALRARSARSARDAATRAAAGAAETIALSGGLFAIAQPSSGAGRVVITLLGGRFRGCPTLGRAAPTSKGARIAATRKAGGARSRVVRQLWSSDNGGDFSTHGRDSVGTVQGTLWLTADRCDGTLTRVVRGLVLVTARHVRRRVLLHAGQSYLAPAVRPMSARFGVGAQRPRSRAWLGIAPAALLALAVGVVIYAAGWLSGLEQGSIDMRFGLRSTAAPRGVAIVAVDSRTFNRLALRWPFPRSLHGRMIDRLRADGVAQIVYDVQFTEPTVPAQDLSLYDAVARAPGTVLATAQEGPQGQTNILGGNARLAAIGALPGSSNLVSDDGVIDRFPLQTGRLDSLAVVADEHITGRAVSPQAFPGRGALIDYRGGAGTFPTYSFSDVLDGAVKASALRGQIVVVGVTDPTLHDVYATPTTSDELMSGAEIWANAIWTTVHGFPLADASVPSSILCILCLGLVAPLSRLRWRGAPAIAGVAVAAGLVYAASPSSPLTRGWCCPCRAAARARRRHGRRAGGRQRHGQSGA